MKIDVLYFARVREELKTDKEQITLESSSATVESLLSLLRSRGGMWARSLDEKVVLCFAVNQQFASIEAVLKEGDEVAVFPPMTGG